MPEKKTSAKKGAKAPSSRSRTSSSRASSGRTASSSAPRRPSRVRNEKELARDKEIVGIIICAAAAIMLVGFLMAPEPDAADVGALGLVSLFIVRLLRLIGGGGAVALPIILLIYGLLTIADKNSYGQSRLVGLLLVFLAFLGLRQQPMELAPFKEYISVAAAGTGGGAVGALLDFALFKTIGHAGSIVVFVTMLLIGLLLALQTSTREMAACFGQGLRRLRRLVGARHTPPAEDEAEAEAEAAAGLGLPPHGAGSRGLPLPSRKGSSAPAQLDAAPVITSAPEVKKKLTPPKNQFVLDYMPDVSGREPAIAMEGLDWPGSETQAATPELPAEPELPAPAPLPAKAVRIINGDAEDEPEPEPALEPQPGAAEAEEPDPPTEEPTPLQVLRRSRAGKRDTSPVAEPGGAAASPAVGGQEYQLPPVDLIEPGIKLRNPRMNKALTDNIGVLENTLESFGVHATVTQVVAGPAVTRYELQPAPGIKVSRITSLADDIALSLAAPGVRIEAPIPGKSAIGIEVARKETDTVYFREMIESEEFANSKAKLSIALGKNIGGESMVGNLAKMPHLLIAGATGSGKSICINTIICSLLYKATPDEVKLMLIDPKKVEMTQYATLPHLIAPVVNDSKKASNALKWVVNEMETRYTLFVGSACKDFEGYNKLNPDNHLPHIVVIIDELADLMMVAKHDVEDSICRLAQMARAAGIHLVVATQRPSVDVITGLIKANIPSRIAFAVSSYTDSRTILDMGGAEKLLGKGDMLYAPIGLNKPMRVQGTFIVESDVARLVEYCCQQAAPKFCETAVAAAVHGEKVGEAAETEDDETDELLYDAAMLIVTTGQASVSFLQRRLAIGNPRAARIMDTLEVKGVVGCSKGAKPRDVLLTADEIEELLG